MVRLRNLQALRAVMETGTVTEAAGRLHRTQPQISRLIHALEEELGFKLFVRERRRLVPTREGEAFYEQTKRILTGLDDVNRIAEEIRSRKDAKLRLVAQPYIAQALLPVSIAAFGRTHPNTRYSLDIRSRGEVGSWVGGHQFDLGVAALPIESPNVTSESFAEVAVRAVLPVDHPLCEKEVLEPRDLANQAFITLKPFTLLRHRIDELFAARGLSPDVRLETSSGFSACQMVSHRLGITLADPLIAQLVNGVTLRPWRPGLTLTYGFFYSRVRPPREIAAGFAEVLAQTARNLNPDDVSLVGQYAE